MKDVVYARVLLKSWKVVRMLSSEISSSVITVQETKVFLKCTDEILLYMRCSETPIKEEGKICQYTEFL